MKIPEALIWALPPEGISGMYIYCEPEMRDNVCRSFSDTFLREWNSAVKKVREEHGGDCDGPEPGIPFKAAVCDKGIYVRIEDLDIPYCEGERLDIEEGDLALKKSLEELEKEYPGISYEGYIAYPWSDSLAGDVVSYEIRSGNIGEPSQVFDFIGEGIKEFDPGMLETDDEEELKELISFLYLYREYADCDELFEGILEYADDTDEDLRPALEERINSLKSGV